MLYNFCPVLLSAHTVTLSALNVIHLRGMVTKYNPCPVVVSYSVQLLSSLSVYDTDTLAIVLLSPRGRLPFDGR